MILVDVRLISAGVRKCSKKSTRPWGLPWALVICEKIFSSHKQTLRERTWWSAVPLPETSGDVQRRPEVTKNPEKAVEKQGLVVQRRPG